MKFCCGVTLFYPTDEELKSIEKYKEIFEKIYIYDNTDNKEKKGELYFKDKDMFIYYGSNENNGLSVAYNKMCKNAIEDGFDYICLFDQDSNISNADLKKCIDYIKRDRDKFVGVYAPEIIYDHEPRVIKDNKEIVADEINWVISSGSFVNLHTYIKIGGFDEEYFIDRIDYDYCMSMKKYAFKTKQLKNVFLFQSLGEVKRTIIGNISQHTALRHYYVYRNRLYYYNKKNCGNFIDKIKVLILSIKHIIRILFFEDNKVEKINMLIRAHKDFNNNNMGKYNDI